jgi:hypothetical protein
VRRPLILALLPALSWLLILLTGATAVMAEQSDWTNLVGLTTISEVISISFHLTDSEPVLNETKAVILP